MKKVILGLLVFMGILLHIRSFAQESISLEAAIEIAKKEVSGRVLKAELEDGIYEVKILTEEGVKIKIKINPGDGTIVRKGKIIK